jgi:hypothetical protein
MGWSPAGIRVNLREEVDFGRKRDRLTGLAPCARIARVWRRTSHEAAKSSFFLRPPRGHVFDLDQGGKKKSLTAKNAKDAKD